MASTSHLGLISSSTITASAGFLAWNWFWSYVAISSRTLKQIYGIDNQANPRQDLRKAEAAIKEGKVTREQVERVERLEAAGANSTDGYAFFATSVLFGLVAGIPHKALIRGCISYSVLRVLYVITYVVLAKNKIAQLRGIVWWGCNASCGYLLYKGAYPST